MGNVLTLTPPLITTPPQMDQALDIIERCLAEETAMSSRPSVVDNPKREAMRIAGDKVHGERTIEVRYPWTGEVVATVPKATRRRRAPCLQDRARLQAHADAARALQDPDEGRRHHRRRACTRSRG